MRRRVQPAMAEIIMGHGNPKKGVKSLYPSISVADLLAAIDEM
jgi:hypothetical protein